VKIVGVDEADMSQGKISWMSPVAKSLLKSQVGDVVELRTPSGVLSLQVLAIHYDIKK